MSTPTLPERPVIVCLCGSTRFFEQFMEANYTETLAGRIVLSVGFFMHRPDTKHGHDLGITPHQKLGLDELHLRKIDMSDEILVVTVNGYIGKSTRREMWYAAMKRKFIRFTEPEFAITHESILMWFTDDTWQQARYTAAASLEPRS